MLFRSRWFFPCSRPCLVLCFRPDQVSSTMDDLHHEDMRDHAPGAPSGPISTSSEPTTSPRACWPTARGCDQASAASRRWRPRFSGHHILLNDDAAATATVRHLSSSISIPTHRTIHNQPNRSCLLECKLKKTRFLITAVRWESCRFVSGCTTRSRFIYCNKPGSEICLSSQICCYTLAS